MRGHLPEQRIADALRIVAFEQLNLHQPAGVPHRQLAEEDCVEHLVNGQVGADSESQREHRRRREARMGAQLTQRILHVLHESHASPSSMRAIMATVRDQFSASAASCFRPARVML